MSKFTEAYKMIFQTLQPLGVTPVDVVDSCLKAQVVANGRGVNLDSVSGQVIITIETPAVKGPKERVSIAEKFDKALVGKHISAGKQTLQFYNSELSAGYHNPLNPSRLNSEYAITFHFLQGH